MKFIFGPLRSDDFLYWKMYANWVDEEEHKFYFQLRQGCLQ